MSDQKFLPGSTIGVMGGGQLGRMFAIAARRMGYFVHIFTPEEETPAGQFADHPGSAGLEGDGVDTTKLPKIIAHRRRMLARPVVQKAVAAEGTEIP